MPDTKPLAKSLHTVSVLVNVAEHCLADRFVTPRSALAEALVILGLESKPDTYGLVEAARKQLVAKRQSNE